VEGIYVRKRLAAVLLVFVLALVLVAPAAQAFQTGAVIANGVCVELANGKGKAVGLHRAHDVSPAVYGSPAACELALP
jgi:hypothetical protein